MHRQGARYGNVMLSAGITWFIRSSLLRLGVVLATLTMPIGATATTNHASDSFRPKDTVAYFEVYHIAHVNVEYRSPTALRDLISRGLRVQDYVRISADNSRAVNALYAALGNTIVSKTETCEFQGGPLDVRWGIVITYADRTREAIGFDDTFDCVQVLSAPKAWRSSRDLLRYVERTFPFMK